MKRRYGLLGVITLSLARRIPRGSSPRRSLSLNPAMANQERRIPGSVLAPLILVAIRQSFDDLGAPLALLRLYGLYDMLSIHRIYPRYAHHPSYISSTPGRDERASLSQGRRLSLWRRRCRANRASPERTRG